MFKSKLWQISILIGLFVVSLTVGIFLGFSEDFKIIDSFANGIYITIKVLALLAIVLIIYLRIIDNYKANSLVILYATLIIQLVPLAARLILATSNVVSVGSKVIVIIFGVISNLSLLGLYLFTEPKQLTEDLE